MQAILHGHTERDGFRLRATEVSRIEAFSDVVFGFALTLLVVSLEVPKTFAELHHMLRGFIPFAISFFILIRVWFEHYRFFRRFGLHDHWTIRINSVLLFVILFYVYPLKFLFTMVVGLTFHTGERNGFTGGNQTREIMVLYGAGFAAVYGLLALLNQHAWRQRKSLALTPLEQLLTRSYISGLASVAAIAVLSCAMACVLPGGYAGWAGLTYILISPCGLLHGRLLRNRRRKLEHAQHRLHSSP